MRVERAEVALRPRGGLESIDLGFAMARHWWRPIARSWLLLVTPLVVALIAALREHPFWAVLALWWLRPLFARVPLFVLARELFGERTGVAQVARALPSLLTRGLFPSLVLQRFSPARAMLLPVLQLEGLSGAARRERCAVLTQRDLGICLGMVGVAAHLNAALIGSLAMLAYLAVPTEWMPDLSALWGSWGEGARDPRWLLLPMLYFAGTSVVEPLLTAGGFALYLNRRVVLEGWDLELAFRRLARRAASLARAALLALALLGGLAAAPPARADEPCRPEDPASARSCIAEVLAGEDFGRSEEVMGWRLREDLFDTDDEEEEWTGLAWLGEWIAAAGEVLLWMAVAAAVIAVAVALFGGRSREPAADAPEPPPARLFGLDLDPSGLPEDVTGAARGAWVRGERAQALSLLYRGALWTLVAGDALRVPAGATELECVGLVRELRPTAAECFETLTLAWLGARYAGSPPGDASFESICAGFDRAFGAAG